jgi:hypothetical protein
MDKEKAKKVGYRDDVECCFNCEYSNREIQDGETFCNVNKEYVKLGGICLKFDHEE